MSTDTPDRGDHNFCLGLLTGAFVGAGLAFWLAPRVVSEIRQRVTGSARDLGDRVSAGVEQVTNRVGDAVDDLTRKGQSVRDDMADTVIRGAQHVERVATAAKS
jgi:hypothetical protein